MKKPIEGGVVYHNKINVTDDNNKIIGGLITYIVVTKYKVKHFLSPESEEIEFEIFQYGDVGNNNYKNNFNALKEQEYGIAMMWYEQHKYDKKLYFIKSQNNQEQQN